MGEDCAPSCGQPWTGESKQPLGVIRREIDTTVATHVAEPVMPKRRMQSDTFVKKLHEGHVFDEI